MTEQALRMNREFAAKAIAGIKKNYAGMGLQMGQTDEEMMEIMLPSINRMHPNGIPPNDVEIINHDVD